MSATPADIYTNVWTNSVIQQSASRSLSSRFINSTSALSVLFFSIIERIVLMALVFCYKDMLEKVTMQRTQQFSAFLLSKEPS